MKYRPLLILAIAYILLTPFAANHLIALLERSPPITQQQLVTADAIVILGGGSRRFSAEYGGSTLNGTTLERLRYGAKLWRASRLPIAVSGGHPRGGTAEATLMQQSLRDDFHLPTQWVEPYSRTTWENARFTRCLLPAHISTIVLVTHAWHIPRARYAFEQAGFHVIPAGTGYATQGIFSWHDFTPQFSALQRLAIVLHETLGLIWYHVLNQISGGNSCTHVSNG
jgi:uncharacterized SAM-binding protein YcdF (DUF218 family)